MSDWREVTLASVCDRIDYGYTAKSVDDDELPRYLRVTDISKARIDWSTVPGCHIDFDEFSRYALRPGDLVIARSGSVGCAKRVRKSVDAVFASYLVRFRPSASVDAAFLGAVIESRAYREWVSRNAGGVAQPNANARVLGSFLFLAPRLPIQRRIGAIADAIDDLIENNWRRVELLEQMAQAIYREWFVRFRFPGHEHTTFVDSPLGPIPDGWAVTTCGETLKFIGGATPSKSVSAYWEGGTIPWYTPSDLTKRPSRFLREPGTFITEAGLKASSTRLFPAASVLMTSRATLGVLAIARREACCNQGFIVVLPDDRWPPSFVYEWLADKSEEVASIGTGATFKEITKRAFKSFPFLVPRQRVLDAYREVVEPLDGEIAALEDEGDVLTRLRDLLLPKLISGQIDVSKLDLDAVLADVEVAEASAPTS